MAEILVLGEVANGELEAITHQLLAVGRKLAESSGDTVAVGLTGHGLDGVAGDAVAHGADKVYLVQDPLLHEPQLDANVAAFEGLCRQVQPGVVLVGKTPTGRDLAPRVAFRLGVGLAQDCVEVRTNEDSGRLVATRPVYGGNAMAKVTFGGDDPQVLTVRPKSFEPLMPDQERRGEVETFEPNLDPSVVRVKRIEVAQRPSQGVRLEDASVVVSGGRGLGGPEPFKHLEELAQMLGGAVGASRAACDAGWVEHTYQVGLTGKSISPDLYITVGISGASQHMAGCSGVKYLVAINKDGEANIFREASFAVVGDWSNVLPAFIETVRELVKS